MDRFRTGRDLSALLALCATLALPTLSAAQDAPRGREPPASDASEAATARHWRGLYELDLGYLERTIPTRYIYAVYPGGTAWDRLFMASTAQARRDASLVRDFATYRAALQRFVVSFEDAHLSAYFNVASRRARWPGFAVKYQGGRYLVVQSTLPDVKAGDAVSSCDGQPIDAWVDRLTAFLGGPKGLETTRAAITPQMFVDRGNPFYALPKVCDIGGATVALHWTDARDAAASVPSEPERTGSPAPTISDPHMRLSDLGESGAWVRIGTMLPSSPEERQEFRKLIEQAPTLRDKEVVVIDVRGNLGGSYNWFMAFLRGLYGQPYADHYARARLEIANTIMVAPSAGGDSGGVPEGYDPQAEPDDPPMSAGQAPPRVQELPGRARLVFNPAPVASIRYPVQPPASPVGAKVYLLTDYGCASACLSFTDEMMRFPGVTQIGAQTHIDRRSGGWPEKFDLPSGLAFVRMGRMVREGRQRGENEAWTPTYRFHGDIADTEAVKRWILDELVPRDRPSRN